MLSTVAIFVTCLLSSTIAEDAITTKGRLFCLSVSLFYRFTLCYNMLIFKTIPCIQHIGARSIAYNIHYNPVAHVIVQLLYLKAISNVFANSVLWASDFSLAWMSDDEETTITQYSAYTYTPFSIRNAIQQRIFNANKIEKRDRENHTTLTI